jgi:hypothetical protein
MYKVQPNIAMIKSTKTTKYPWYQMGVGDSFLVPFAERNKVHAAASQVKKRKGLVFRLHKTEKGIRVWRIL